VPQAAEVCSSTLVVRLLFREAVREHTFSKQVPGSHYESAARILWPPIITNYYRQATRS